MISVRFKNLDRSDFIYDSILERIEAVVEKFPDLKNSRLYMTVEMENSPLQAGPDLFSIKVVCMGGRYHGVMLKKSAENPYLALADVVDHMLERLNRFGDHQRVKARSLARRTYGRMIDQEDDLLQSS